MPLPADAHGEGADHLRGAERRWHKIRGNTDYNFCSSGGINEPTGVASSVARLVAANEAAGKNCGGLVLTTVIAWRDHDVRGGKDSVSQPAQILAAPALHETRKAVAAAAIGNVLEWYDFGVYIFFAGTIARQFFPAGDPATALLSSLAVFGVGFLMRPLGGIVIGRFGDTHGCPRGTHAHDHDDGVRYRAGRRAAKLRNHRRNA